MWTRMEIKTRAKAVLRNNYWRAFIVSIVLLIAGVGYSNSNIYTNKSAGNSNRGHLTVNNIHLRDVANSAKKSIRDTIASIDKYRHGGYDRGRANTYTTSEVISTYVYRIDSEPFDHSSLLNIFSFGNIHYILMILLALGFVAIVVGFMLLFRILVGYALEVGGRRYFINAADNPKTDMKVLGIAFKGESFFNVLSTLFLRDLFTFLWSLLFVIPGIVKSFEYSLVAYILADNPRISRQRAFELSKKMTYGNKWEMFVLNLSFIGWYLLGSLCFGIGVVFVYPYENATKAELYIKLRDNAINTGLVSCEELSLLPVYDYVDTTISTN